MITPDQVMPLLLKACPSFTDTWLSIEEENKDDSVPAGRLLYLDAGDFVRHLAGLKGAGTTDEFNAVFDVIERLVVEGDDYVSNLGVIGFIEGFQMHTVTSFGLDPEIHFRPHLRPISHAWWIRVNRFWAGEHDALQATDEQIAFEASKVNHRQPRLARWLRRRLRALPSR